MSTHRTLDLVPLESHFTESIDGTLEGGSRKEGS